VATSIEVSPPPTTTTRLPTCFRRPSLKALRKAVAVTTLGVVALAGQRAAALGAEAEEHRVELLADLCSIVTSVPMRVFSRSSTPRSRMRWISASRTSRGVRKPGMP
jgi:hypothetical protein